MQNASVLQQILPESYLPSFLDERRKINAENGLWGANRSAKILNQKSMIYTEGGTQIHFDFALFDAKNRSKEMLFLSDSVEPLVCKIRFHNRNDQSRERVTRAKRLNGCAEKSQFHIIHR